MSKDVNITNLNCLPFTLPSKKVEKKAVAGGKKFVTGTIEGLRREIKKAKKTAQKMDDETKNFEADAESFAASISDLEIFLSAIIATPLEEQLLAADGPIDKAQICLLYSYIIHSLVFR
ncbi:hypothetical protein HK100_000253 [Physocladia obscura]|uniref:Uncharacterized protein n=1 Tax=Physocladia obscura TaxID=109957 RepID=A0AAD5T0F7_9FUNG|nr:hypothetical protein HK100_000253 [Physocladia obscura]